MLCISGAVVHKNLTVLGTVIDICDPHLGCVRGAGGSRIQGPTRLHNSVQYHTHTQTHRHARTHTQAHTHWKNNVPPQIPTPKEKSQTNQPMNQKKKNLQQRKITHCVRPFSPGFLRQHLPMIQPGIPLNMLSSNLCLWSAGIVCRCHHAWIG